MNESVSLSVLTPLKSLLHGEPTGGHLLRKFKIHLSTYFLLSVLVPLKLYLPLRYPDPNVVRIHVCHLSMRDTCPAHLTLLEFPTMTTAFCALVAGLLNYCLLFPRSYKFNSLGFVPGRYALRRPRRRRGDNIIMKLKAGRVWTVFT
jgi:hypothetical protein